MRRVLLLVVALLALTTPTAFAANGDAKVTIYDVTAGSTVCVGTPTNTCSMNFIAGHRYSFTAQEATNQASKIINIRAANSNTKFTDRASAWGYTGSPNPCTLTDSPTDWKIVCNATTDRVLYAQLIGTATSSADGAGLASVKRGSQPLSSVSFTYTTP